MYELDLEFYLRKKPEVQRKKGRFQKGHTPHNKGKKWKEWMSEEGEKKILAGLRHTGRKDIGGWNKKKCVRIDEENKFVVYGSITAAAEINGVKRENIKKVCQKKRNKCGGYRWYYEEDCEWMKIIE